MTLTVTGDRATFAVTFEAPLQDPWGMGVGFSLQTVFILIDHQEGGQQAAPPGLNVEFDRDSAWDSCIVLSPQQPARLRQRAERFATNSPSTEGLIIPDRTVGRGSTITAQVPLTALGEGDPAKWGYQVLVLGNDNLPEPGLLFTQRIERNTGRHHFGGSKGACSPNVLDLLGTPAQLRFECQPGGGTRLPATLTMARQNLRRLPPSVRLRQRQEARSQGRSEIPSP